jgi:hypothetical protein
MNRLILSVLIAFPALVAQTANADLMSFDFAAASNASIQFIGNSHQIQFPSTSTSDFTITDATSFSLAGLHGAIGGTFVVGTIATAGALEQANITTSDGVFSVDDGVGNSLTADLNWDEIFVYNNLFGALNVSGVTNLSNFHYAGSNSALLAIRNGGSQSIVLTFQFSPLARKSLTQLMTAGQVNSTSFSGSLSAVPEPSTLALLGCGLFGLLAYSLRRQR